MRIDKWLWAARFYKTRQLAAKAVKTGKIHINSQSISKPATRLAVGDLLRVQRGPYQAEVEVLVLSERRGSATVAATLYEETQASIDARQALKEQLAALPKVFSDRRKPDKRGVREHRAFKRQPKL